MDTICFELDANQMIGSVVNEKGQICSQSTTPYLKGSGLLLAQSIFEATAQLCDSAWLNPQQVQGVGIAVPGLIDKQGKQIMRCPELGLRKLALASMLAEDLPEIPVRIFNSAQMAAVGEYQQGALKGNRNSVLLELADSVNGGLLVEGQLFRGGNGQGFMPGLLHLDQARIAAESCNIPALLEAGRQLMAQQPEAPFARRCGGIPVRLTARNLAESTAAGDEAAASVFRPWLEDVATLVAAIIHLIDPQKLAIRGPVVDAGDAFFQPLQERVRELVLTDNPCQIVPAKLGVDGCLLGIARQEFKPAIASFSDSFFA